VLARTVRLALGAVVLFAVALTFVVVASIAAAGADPPDRRPAAPPGSAARPWLAPAPPEDDELHSSEDTDPQPRSTGWTPRSLGLLLGACVLVSIVGGAIVGVVLGSTLI